MRKGKYALKGSQGRLLFKLHSYLVDPHCRYCGIPMLNPTVKPKPGCSRSLHRSCTVDHMTPTAMGGADNERNWIICCWKCNQAKGRGPRWKTLAELLS